MFRKEQNSNYFNTKRSQSNTTTLCLNKHKGKKFSLMNIQQTSLIMSDIKQYKKNIALMQCNRLMNEISKRKLPQITSEIKRRETITNQSHTTPKELVIKSLVLNDSLSIEHQTNPKQRDLNLPLCYLKINSTPRLKYAIPGLLSKINNKLIFKGLKHSLSNFVMNNSTKCILYN